QSLRAVDAWIDVINANINGGVRTAYKSSRLKFGGSNVTIGRAGNATSLPLQIPETGLMTANTVIDFSQGAITASTENTHLAVQGDGFFVIVDPASVNTNGTLKAATSATRLFVTRDGEFHTNQAGMLVNAAGYVLITASYTTATTWNYNSGTFGAACAMRAVYNNLDTSQAATVATQAIRLSDYISQNIINPGIVLADGVSTLPAGCRNLVDYPQGKQALKYSPLGSTVFDLDYQMSGAQNPSLSQAFPATTSTVLSKSLEASNASMTQSVPELSLAQKLFSALTKVLQISQTNTDAVLNLIR
ncbi:MAG: hypothetical protein H7338_14650, partial [Candidatus Sericytochromatia bacterium]|nr:hypothetical protein [Candidatus Sericytochromatia bacterium]